ncbi:hypothetical protein Tco_0224647, partial [Tanacetum coccineum]
TWMAFGGNTHDLGSFGEETDKITDLHQIHEEVLFTERGDGVAGIKRHRRDPASDGVKDLTTASEHFDDSKAHAFRTRKSTNHAEADAATSLGFWRWRQEGMIRVCL